MSKKRHLDLSTFEGRLLNGLNFCRKVYDLFDQVREEADGIAKLRLRASKREKRLFEELIPIARYIQAHYREGRRIKVRWVGESKPYDAVLLSAGALVERSNFPKKLFVEVTISVHQNDYLARRLLHERGGSFGIKGISRDKKTGSIISTPHVYNNDEIIKDLASQIIERLKAKSQKPYPPKTVLIINCVADTLILESEWKDVVARVISTQLHLAFYEVFLVETVMSHSTILHGNKKRRVIKRKTSGNNHPKNLSA